MPTSDLGNIAPIIREACRLGPKTVLDVGMGCGKYGVLLREYLDSGWGRYRPDQWKVRIDGIEGFGDYVIDLHRSVYNGIFVEDFAAEENLARYKGYDLVVMVDSLEHLDKERGMHVLRTFLKQNKHVIVSAPMGMNFLEQGAVNGNEFERHRGRWVPEDFTPFTRAMIHNEVCTVFSLPGKG